MKTLYIEGTREQLDDLVESLQEDGECQIDAGHAIVLMEIGDEDAADAGPLPNARIQEEK